MVLLEELPGPPRPYPPWAEFGVHCDSGSRCANVLDNYLESVLAAAVRRAKEALKHGEECRHASAAGKVSGFITASPSADAARQKAAIGSDEGAVFPRRLSIAQKCR